MRVSRRKFLRAGALWLPTAAALAQVPTKRPFHFAPIPPGIIAADLELWRGNGGYGWASDAVISSNANPTPKFKSITTLNPKYIGADCPALYGGGMFWCRTLAIKNNWNSIRIALLWSIDLTGGTAAYNGIFGVTNADKIWASAGCNVLAWMTGGGSAWTFSGGANAFVTTGATDLYCVTNVNAVFSNVGLGSSVGVQTTQSSHKNLTVIYINKQSPQVASWMATSAPNHDFSYDSMYDVILNAALGSGYTAESGVFMNYNANAIAFNQANGASDSIHLYFSGVANVASALHGVLVQKIT